MAEAKLQQLTSLVSSGKLNEAQNLVTELKIAYISEQLNESLYLKVLEQSVLIEIQSEDLDKLLVQIQQLLSLYETQNSDQKTFFISVYLLALLVLNQSSEFHSCLETLENTTDPLIDYCIDIERKLMLGYYDQVLSTKTPRPEFDVFVTQLQQTVRDSIADNLETAYDSLPLSSAAQLLGEDDIQGFISMHRLDWIVENDRIVFKDTEPDKTVPADLFMNHTLTYATELERII